jgi:hypothetical protein
MSRNASETCESQPCKYDGHVFPAHNLVFNLLLSLVKLFLALGTHIILFQQAPYQPIHIPTMFSTLNLNTRNHPSTARPLIRFAGYE